MLGAIVGDLAAWTYENDKERFYSSLTTKEALLSPVPPSEKVPWHAASPSQQHLSHNGYNFPFY